MGLNGAFPDDSTISKHNVIFKASSDCAVSIHTKHCLFNIGLRE